MSGPCVIVGRGASADGLQWPSPYPVVAVSSGIFRVPQECPPEHFVTVDAIKFFMRGLNHDSTHCWEKDDKSKHWDFWTNDRVCKHVLYGYVGEGYYHAITPETIRLMPGAQRAKFQQYAAENPHAYGFQPMWGDYPNVTGWPLQRERVPNFDRPGQPLGLSSHNNSLLMAVQVAHLLGYTHLFFAGVDLSETRFSGTRRILREWYFRRLPRALRWSVLDGASQIGDWMPSAHLEAVA